MTITLLPYPKSGWHEVFTLRATSFTPDTTYYGPPEMLKEDWRITEETKKLWAAPTVPSSAKISFKEMVDNYCNCGGPEGHVPNGLNCRKA